MSPRAVIRVDAGPDIGQGHVLRMRSLAQALARRGVDVEAIGRGIGPEEVEGTPWAVTPLEGPAVLAHEDLEVTAFAIGSSAPDVVIVDHYALGEDWERGVAERLPGTRIVAMDDLPGRIHDVDALIDPNLGLPGPQGIPGSSPRMLAGTAYAPLGDEYRAPAERSPSRTDCPNVLVTLGGGRSRFIVRLAQALAEAAELRHVAIEFVVPDPTEHAEVMRMLGRRPGCSVHGRVPTMRPFIERADLVVGAGGMSAWQRLRLGRPSVIVSLAENQVRTGQALERLGVARWVGIDAAAVVEVAIEALNDEAIHRRAVEYGPLLVDGLGAERIAMALFPPSVLPTLRPVESRDAAALLAMANDPITRASSREVRSIHPEEHLAWFRSALGAASPTFWVAEVEGLVVGQVRFVPLSDGWELSYGLDPIGRGLGWSRPMVEQGLRLLALSGRAQDVFAVIHSTNTASRRSLLTLGFVPDEQGRAAAAGARLPEGFTAYLLAHGRVSG